MPIKLTRIRTNPCVQLLSHFFSELPSPVVSAFSLVEKILPAYFESTSDQPLFVTGDYWVNFHSEIPLFSLRVQTPPSVQLIRQQPKELNAMARSRALILYFRRTPDLEHPNIPGTLTYVAPTTYQMEQTFVISAPKFTQANNK
ncbi:hypothetical protein H0H93_003146 [Arthromyces matolae]|nr:hypothetical protein H0H93_003146 [Arthromyces matolae]